MANGKTVFSMRIDKDFHKRVKMLAVEEETTITAMFIECMEKRMAEAEKKKKEK